MSFELELYLANHEVEMEFGLDWTCLAVVASFVDVGVVGVETYTNCHLHHNAEEGLHMNWDY